MKRLRVLFAVLAILTLALMIAGCGGSSGGSGSTDNTVSLTILETSDVHDHAGGYGSAASYSPMITGNDAVLGGYARLATYISDVKNQKGANNVLLCDDGDFTMGTVYEMTLASTSPLSFMFFSIVGYDAINIGNHEFDLGPNTLYSFITNAQANTTYPFSTPILASNMNASGSASMTQLINDHIIVKSMIIEKAGIKIGLLGVMGPNAVFDAPLTSPDLAFNQTYPALQTQVNALRAAGAQTVVLLSHEGFTVSGGHAKGNDALLADNVSGIDVILSGHLHINQTAVTTGANPNTILVEPGEYGEHIARLDLKIDKTTGKVTSYTSTNPIIDDTIVGDSWMNYIVGTQVNSALNIALAPAFTGLGLTGVTSILDTVAVNGAQIDKTSISTLGSTTFPVGESVLGNLAADSYRNMINLIWYSHGGGSAGDAAMTWATGDANRVQIAFVPGGVIRDPLAVEDGTISFADLYNVLPLGGDSVDTTAFGYPLLTTYIKATDLYKIVGLLIQTGMDLSHAGAYADDTYFINFAGIYVKIYANAAHSLTGLGYDIYLCPNDSSGPNIGMNSNIPSAAGPFIVPVDTTPNYKIAVDLYTLMVMYELAALHPSDPNYVLNTYATASSTTPLPAFGATGNRVWTSLPPNKNRTLRGWQGIVEWSWLASGGTTAGVGSSPLSAAGYYTTFPYKRIQLAP